MPLAQLKEPWPLMELVPLDPEKQLLTSLEGSVAPVPKRAEGHLFLCLLTPGSRSSP
ncbi:ribosomal protein S6 kinase A1 [Homo sapiens]|uniref:Ribosomal protein S6 kinase A1 n=3 Tax=Hominidae TaxID=9604 RepID=E9PPC1_HUMAN|nr:ribosomal protein S6 kinase A1 [Homo sapiens]PNJ20535.1 RPS6KA1 isoform 20 [Pongo abelii]